MRIKSKANEITTQLFHPAEQRLSILVGVSATGAVRRFRVYTHAAKKDRLSIQQNICAARFDGTKANEFIDRVRSCADHDLIQFGAYRRPALESLRIDV